MRGNMTILAVLAVAFCGCGSERTPDESAADEGPSPAGDGGEAEVADSGGPGPDGVEGDEGSEVAEGPDEGPAPQAWPTCEDGPSTPETLAEKATHYDELAERLHLHPQLQHISTVQLKPEAPPLESATWDDVAVWETDANDGLWNALYMLSQIYRYATTKDPGALETLRILMLGQQTRMAITGVPGLYTRRLRPPDLPGAECPTDDASYTADVEKDDDRWVKIGDSGCVEYVAHETGEWTVSAHCGLEQYAGWCWYDNVSQDEYAGHVYALGAMVRLVDDPDLVAAATDHLEQIGEHLASNELRFIDWDGRVTEHGAIFAPAMALAFTATAAAATGREDLWAFHDECLLQSEGENECLSWLPASLLPFTDFLDQVPLYLGCKSNWNNISMALTSYQGMLWFERDPEVLALARTALDEGIFRAEDPMALKVEKNPWYTFLWASSTGVGPEDPVAQAAMEDALCALARFPASRAQEALNATELYETACTSRLGNPFAAEIVPPEHRCPTKMLWWFPPYKLDQCDARPERVFHPTDYLLAYWMGRFHGYISPEQ